MLPVTEHIKYAEFLYELCNVNKLVQHIEKYHSQFSIAVYLVKECKKKFVLGLFNVETSINWLMIIPQKLQVLPALYYFANPLGETHPLHLTCTD